MVYGVNGVFFEVYNFIGCGEQYYFILIRGQIDVDQFIVFVQVDCDDIGGMWMVEFGQCGFFYGIVGGCYKDVDVFFVFVDWQDGGDVFIGFQWQQVDDWLIVCVVVGFWQLIDFYLVQMVVV